MQAHNPYLSPFLGALVHSLHWLSPLIALRFFLLGRVISILEVGTPIRHFSGLSPFDSATFSAHCSCTYTTPVSYSLPLFIPLAPLARRSRGHATPFSYFIFFFISRPPLSTILQVWYTTCETHDVILMHFRQQSVLPCNVLPFTCNVPLCLYKPVVPVLVMRPTFPRFTLTSYTPY